MMKHLDCYWNLAPWRLANTVRQSCRPLPLFHAYIATSWLATDRSVLRPVNVLLETGFHHQIHSEPLLAPFFTTSPLPLQVPSASQTTVSACLGGWEMNKHTNIASGHDVSFLRIYNLMLTNQLILPCFVALCNSVPLDPQPATTNYTSSENTLQVSEKCGVLGLISSSTL